MIRLDRVIQTRSATVADGEATDLAHDAHRCRCCRRVDATASNDDCPLSRSVIDGHSIGYTFPDVGNGRAANRRRHGLAMSRAHWLARLTRALSVAMPVFAYICR